MKKMPATFFSVSFIDFQSFRVKRRRFEIYKRLE